MRLERDDAAWLNALDRTGDGSVDINKTLNGYRVALDALETAAMIHPKGPTVLILRGRGWSYRDIAEYCKVGSHRTIESIHSKIKQAVIGKGYVN